MAKKEETLRQYFIDGLNIEKIIDYHIERKQPVNYNLNPDNPLHRIYLKNDHEKKVRKGQVLDNSRLPLYRKIEYIIHLIAYRSTNNKCGVTNLNASILQRLIGNDYHEILLTLQEMEVITNNGLYKIGEYSKSYAIHKNYNEKISSKITINPKLIEYNNKAINLIKEYGKPN